MTQAITLAALAITMGVSLVGVWADSAWTPYATGVATCVCVILLILQATV